jgi:hypothetical protein
MTPRERLTHILRLQTIDFLNTKGFLFIDSKSQFNRTVNKIRHIIYFEGNKWNNSDTSADYRLLCKLEIKEYPKWYIETYQTDQATHHQGRIDKKTISQPSPSKNYKVNWDAHTQINGKYDLLKYSELEIKENIFKNITNSILPYLEICSTYSGIAEYSLEPLDSFDYYMMDNNKSKALEILEGLIIKIKNLDKSKLNLDDEFVQKSVENTLNMTNLRIQKFFPDLKEVNLNI